MEEYFTIKQIASKVNKSTQAIYNLMRNNIELMSLLPNNHKPIKNGRKYSTVIYDWIINYYAQIEDNEDLEENTTIGELELENQLLKKDIEHLTEKINILEQMIEELKTEKQNAISENGALLMLFAQEKQEKQKLLESSADKEKRIGIFSRLFNNRK
ncbi:MAG: hypothetical protein J6A29_03450 [Clostridia bacterium]|nr:hypothetical protein [Clostridia bacterium]